MMRIMGMEPTSEQLHSLVESIDVDGNGKIELEEFANMMARQMLLRDGKVRRASSPHLTSPHPRAPVEGVYPLERLPGTLWCCAVLQGARQLPLHGSKGVGSRLPGCIRLQPPTHREGRSPDPLGSVVWGQWRAVAGAVPWPRPTAQQ